MSAEPEVLNQDFTLGYTYTRSTGPIVGRFLTELRNRKVVGIKGSDGKVIVPPVEYDPVTAEALSEFVDVADTGTVQTWSWIKHPRPSHLLQKPFAFALILMDGADTPMLHMVDAGDEAAMSTGMKVKVRWADEPKGFIDDIAYFVAADSADVAGPLAAIEDLEDITGVECPIYLKYNFTAGSATSRFLTQIKQGKIVGQKCPSCLNVYVPPRGSCASCGVATTEEVECNDKATVESFTIVYIPIPGHPVKPPYVIANLVADGSNISFLHLLSECVNEDVHMGQRVQAVWRPQEEWTYAMDNILYFKPLDEPDVPHDLIGKVNPSDPSYQQGEG
ncbi:Zn-ribbon domain-containing OB-fold protein [Oceanicoccus sp. KOV_DT_Chl]|uniref:Zn-ribbon domain-containing OB-fold protein n=1 Tax=Oceanicoccus sp. KOV_DT_Chl TaxID=1904639 RepID=UPI000C7C013B|nr:OB-fold nucleic acid binding domain-containing protein [Oceanicoccus sp. KOV_DT_Chl]